MDLPRLCVLDHAEEFCPPTHQRSADALIGVDVRQLPAGVFVNDTCEGFDLRVQAVLLELPVCADAAVRSHLDDLPLAFHRFDDGQLRLDGRSARRLAGTVHFTVYVSTQRFVSFSL